jgi:hypothetical protein
MNEYITRSGRTEDGDYIMTRTIECDSFVEARQQTKRLNNEVTRIGTKLHYNIKWTAKDGKLVWTDTYVVDQAEVAIEASNDYYAWLRGDDEERYW